MRRKNLWFNYVKVFITFQLFFVFVVASFVWAEDKRGFCDPPPYNEPPSAFNRIQATGETVWHKDVNSGCSWSDHNITLEIDAEPEDISDVSIKMTNYDVDYQSTDCSNGPEIDYLYINDNYVGQLQGANNSWSTNIFTIPSTYLVKGENKIFVDTDATNTNCWCVGVGYVEVTGKVGFQVVEYTPSSDEKNVRWDDPNITIDFSNEVKESSANTNSIILDYRDKDGNWVAVNTVVSLPSVKQVKVTPSGDLKDGIRYRMRILDGPSGVLDKSDAELDASVTWYFWTMVNLDGQTAELVKPNTTKDKMQITWFNSSRNKDLIPIKWVVNRIYLLWDPKEEVFDADEVTEFKADVSLAVNGSTTTLSDQTIKRYDKYSTNEKRMAKNTVNFDRLGSSGSKEEYKLTVEPKPQSSTAKTFTKEATANVKGSTPSLSYNAWACAMAGWYGGPVAGELNAAKSELTKGKTYTSHMFPIVGCNQNYKGTIDRGAGGFNMEYVETKHSAWWGDSVRFVKNLSTNAELEEIRHVMLHLESLKPAAHKFIIGLVPDDALPGANGVSWQSTILLAEGNFNASTVAHEIGHQYDIASVTGAGCTNEHNNDGKVIEGFNVYSMKNKSYTEGNSEYVAANHNDCNGNSYKTAVLPLMNKWGVDTNIRWLRPENYEQLMTKLGAASISSMELAALTGEYMVVTGSTDASGYLNQVAPLYNVSLPHIGLPQGSGYTVTLYSGENGTGTVLSSYDFNTQILHIDGPTRNEEFDSNLFAFTIPFDDTAQSLVLDGPDNSITVNRSDNGAAAPVVSWISPVNGDTISGDVNLSWTGSDDGGTVYYRLEYTADGISWIPVSGQLLNTNSYQIDTTNLPSGTGQKFALIASDGFNTTRLQIDIQIDNFVTVQSTYPENGASDVSLKPIIDVTFVTEMDPSTINSDSFQVLKYGDPVSGEVTYNEQSKTATFSPDQELDPSTAYVVNLVSGSIYDNNVVPNTLASDYQFSFYTESSALNPQVESVVPANGTGNNPVNPIVQAFFTKALDPLTLSDTTFVLEDEAGSAVVGTVSYNSSANAATFTPDTALNANTEYTAKLMTGIQDTQGLGLENEYSWTFETGSEQTSGVRVVDVIGDSVLDTDSDGLYDQLIVSVQLEVLTTATYNINAQLKDKNGEDLNWSSAQGYYQPGVYNVDIVFSGSDIGNNGVDGPYTVTNIYAYNTWDSSVYFSYQESYLTSAYAGTSFYSVLSLDLDDISIAADSGLNENIIELETRANHATQDVSTLTYSISSNSNTDVTVSIDNEHNLDIEPASGFTGYTDVTIQLKDSQNVQVSNTIRIYVLKNFSFVAPGFYLISFPVTPDVSGIESALSSIQGKYNSVWSFENGQWKAYNPNLPGLSDTLMAQAGTGFWIDINQACNLTVLGSDNEGTATSLVAGWNLAGYNSNLSLPPETALSSISGKYLSVWAYIDGEWKVYVPDNPATTTLTIMEPGVGYWINAIDAGVWTID